MDLSRGSERPEHIKRVWTLWVSKVYGWSITKLLEGVQQSPAQILGAYRERLRAVRLVFQSSLQAPLAELETMMDDEPLRDSESFTTPADTLVMWWREYRKYETETSKIHALGWLPQGAKERNLPLRIGLAYLQCLYL